MLRELFQYFLDNEEILISYGGRIREGEETAIAVADFIAGMTDRFAINLYNEIFLPRPWSVV